MYDHVQVGHVVGFHHTAGMGTGFDGYDYDLCGSEKTWPVLQHPTCEVNIMGVWYHIAFLSWSLIAIELNRTSASSCA